MQINFLFAGLFGRCVCVCVLHISNCSIRMDVKEGMTSPKEHRISVVDNPSTGSSERVGIGIDDEDSSNFPTKSDVDKEWIRELENKIYPSSVTQWRLRVEHENIPLICQLMLTEISRPKLETVGEFSRPSAVAIGPIHRREYCKRSISDDEKWVIVGWMNVMYLLDLADCLFTLKKEVLNALDSFSTFDKTYHSYFKNNKGFAEMLLLDSYFILFVLTVKILKRPSSYTLAPIIYNYARTPRTVDLFQDNTTEVLDIIFNKDKIAPDLLILDNQIPFFVIEKLFEKLEPDKPLHKYALEFFETIHPGSTQGCMDQDSPPEFLHLLHLFHWSRVPQNKHIIPSSFSSPQQLDSVECPRLYIPNAMELRESATMFEKNMSSSSLDIKFRGRTITPIIRVFDIPELHIRDYSSIIFHNLIAFEIQSSNRGCSAMAFSILMRNLLQSEEDVKLLRQKGILASSSMDNNKLIYLFRNLSRLTENYQMPKDLFDTLRQVRSHHESMVSRICGSIILKYFPNPLVTLSVAGAAMIFVLTLLQTIYTMTSYYHRS